MLILVTAVGGSLVAHAAPPPHVITLSDAEPIGGRTIETATRYRRPLEAARRSLLACHELALADAPKTRSEIDADIDVAPNGEVMRVTLTPRGSVADFALVCFRRRLAMLAFEPPGSMGAVVRVALILGEPPGDAHPPLAINVTPASRLMVGPIPIHLGATPPARGYRSVRTAVHTVKECAITDHPTSPITIAGSILVSESDDIARFDATSSAAEAAPILRCVAKTSWPSAEGNVTRIDLRLVVAPNGEVSLAP